MAILHTIIGTDNNKIKSIISVPIILRIIHYNNYNNNTDD